MVDLTKLPAQFSVEGDVLLDQMSGVFWVEPDDQIKKLAEKLGIEYEQDPTPIGKWKIVFMRLDAEEGADDE